jgi:hypothetical protein
MTESIGNLYSTIVPALSDTADIQEALRVYHYGAPSGTGSGEYPISNSATSLLKPNSIAGFLNNLQNQISSFEAGVLPEAYNAKGVLISATAPGSPAALQIPTLSANGQVLTIDTAEAVGLKWSFPSVTLDNQATLTNKSIAPSGLKFEGSGSGSSFAITLIIPTNALTENKTIQFPATADMPAPSTTLVGRDTFDTLTNKSMSVGQLTGTIAISGGGTGATTAANARSNLEIFNTQSAVTAGNDRTQYSGKIYVADPAIVGPNGASLDGAAQGDLWFW